MDIGKLKKVNEEVLDMAIDKLEKSWDITAYEILSKAIKNLQMIEKYDINKSEKKFKEENMKKDKKNSEFDKLSYQFIKSHPDKEGTIELLEMLSEFIDDLEVLQPRIYEILMEKMKELC